MRPPLTSPPGARTPQLYSFSETEEAIAMANDTSSGLASYFFTNDLRRAWKVAEALEYGMVRQMHHPRAGWSNRFQ